MTKILQDLEERRKELGMTYKELAYQSGLRVDTVRCVLQGWQWPNLLTAIAIASSLELRIGFFVKSGKKS